MTYDELIKELCDVIKESELNSVAIYENLEKIELRLGDYDLPLNERKKLEELISNSYGLLQHQDLHRQKIERVVNYVCETNNIDTKDLNIANSAKYISGDDSSEVVSNEELEDLIKSMKL